MENKPQLYDIVPIGGKKAKLKLNLHKGQLQVWDSQKRFIAFLAGTQSGKTSFAPHWLYREIQQKGEGDYLVVTSTYPLLNLKLLPEFLTVFGEVYELGTYNKSERVFYFHNDKTRIIFASAENPESIESATAKAAVLDEAGQVQFKKSAYEAILRRLSLAQGRVLITTTLYGMGWLKTDIYDKWKKKDPDVDVIQMDSIVNPAFPREEYERAKASMPDWKFKLFYQGQYATPVGLIYDAFDSETSVVKRFPIPERWQKYCGMDFGNDTAAVFFAIDPDTGFAFAYREYLESGKSTVQHVEDLLEKSKGERFIKISGGAPGDDGWRGDFTKAGWKVSQPSVKHVEVGIDRVYSFFKLKKLFVFSDLYELLREIQTYSYKLDENNHPTGDIENKQRFHLADAMRYILGEFNTSGVSQGKVIIRSYV